MVASLVLPRFGIDQGQAAIGSFLLFLVNSLIPGTVGIAIWGVDGDVAIGRHTVPQ